MAETNDKSGFDLFMDRVRPYFLDEDMQLIERGYTFAHYGHRNQTRMSGKKYLIHPKAVTLIAVEELKIYDGPLAAGNLIHDVSEDSHLLNEKVTSLVFGREIALDHKLVTKPAPDYFGRLRDFRRWRPLTTKGCDRLDNMRTVGDFEEQRRRRYVIETREQIIPLLDVLEEVIPVEYAHAVPYLREQLHAECDKWD